MGRARTDVDKENTPPRKQDKPSSSMKTRSAKPGDKSDSEYPASALIQSLATNAATDTIVETSASEHLRTTLGEASISEHTPEKETAINKLIAVSSIDPNTPTCNLRILCDAVDQDESNLSESSSQPIIIQSEGHVPGTDPVTPTGGLGEMPVFLGEPVGNLSPYPHYNLKTCKRTDTLGP